MCTDGLTSMLTDDDIATLLVRESLPRRLPDYWWLKPTNGADMIIFPLLSFFCEKEFTIYRRRS